MLPFRLKKQTSKNVADTTFKISSTILSNSKLILGTYMLSGVFKVLDLMMAALRFVENYSKNLFSDDVELLVPP